VLLGIGVLAVGCTPAAHNDGGNPSSTPNPTGGPTPSPRAAPTEPQLPAVASWQPSSNDISPAAKVSAVRRIERAGNTTHSALEVLDAQYGGILSSTASVLVVTRTWTRSSSGELSAGGRTFDVRLSLRGSSWRVTAIHPSIPGPRARQLTAAARKVLASDQIVLPPAARRDVRSGRVHDSVLDAMLAVAKPFRIEISVIRSGHPIHVFGTDRLSDHPQGRAFDTWRINGHPVVDPRTSRQLVTDYMHTVADAGSYNVGGPYLLGSAPQWFSDDTHHDHVHAGFIA
jgi:hypothetical protein